MDPQSRSLDAALSWASVGIRVLPIRPNEKAPLTRNGLNDATTDRAQLEEWWARWPNANVGIATGAPGVDVLDVDVRGKHSGWRALGRLRKADILPLGAPTVRTPSGGIHLYFMGTQQRNGSIPDEHLDFRSAGGYVLVPPSKVTAVSYAGAYRWERRTRPTATLDWQAAANLLRPPPPDFVADPQRRPHRPGWDVHTLAAAVAREKEGNRNRLLFWALCEALRSGYGDLRPIANAGLECGLSIREVQATWRQAVRRIPSGSRDRPFVSAAAEPSRRSQRIDIERKH